MKYFSHRALLVCLLCLFSSLSQAVGISAYRIYLDSDSPSTSFSIYNKDVESQNCQLSLTHYYFDANSEMYNIKEGEIPANSAQDWMRFSPKEFQLTPANAQTIRFTIRRKADSESAEYRSYLVVDCGAATAANEQETLINIKPKLLHNVPIIVRTGTLDASIHAANVEVNGDNLNFTIERKGNRSIYGDIELINKSNDEVISSQTGFSIYTESERFPFKLAHKGVPLDQIIIRVKENPNFGGNITYEVEALKAVQKNTP